MSDDSSRQRFKHIILLSFSMIVDCLLFSNITWKMLTAMTHNSPRKSKFYFILFSNFGISSCNIRLGFSQQQQKKTAIQIEVDFSREWSLFNLVFRFVSQTIQIHFSNDSNSFGNPSIDLKRHLMKRTILDAILRYINPNSPQKNLIKIGVRVRTRPCFWAFWYEGPFLYINRSIRPHIHNDSWRIYF